MLNQISANVAVGAEAGKEDFFPKISHDIKNPLTAAIGSIDIVREGCLGPVNEEQQEYLMAAIDSCNEIVIMLDNLLDIRKFDSGKTQMTIRPYKTIELISNVTNQFARQAKHDDVEFSVDLEAGASDIAVDSSSFTRVLKILLGNALKSTHEGGKITVSSGLISGEDVSGLNKPVYAAISPVFSNCRRFVQVVICNSDNEVSADEPEYRFDSHATFTQKEEGAIGVGLAYCKLAIESFQGTIWKEHKTEHEIKYVILLPCCLDTSNGNY